MHLGVKHHCDFLPLTLMWLARCLFSLAGLLLHSNGNHYGIHLEIVLRENGYSIAMHHARHTFWSAVILLIVRNKIKSIKSLLYCTVPTHQVSKFVELNNEPTFISHSVMFLHIVPVGAPDFKSSRLLLCSAVVPAVFLLKNN